ncbi:Panacea domain-containing protein [Psychrobacter sp. Pi2-51]|uniref:Panacea domain-containing protein n=1 Tax=Psychrobacter sp. Pi2-51 TaxID=2774132 RepID=UPI00191A4A2E|nr:type II toxin-antitoxin system antitoxin SocA domain-containing protein [Psychrobacter sp. Pi2-51]
MRYSAIAIANAFIEQSNNGKTNNLTPMKLQKLMFFAQSWYLKSNHSALFDGYFERWQYGPVLPEIYHEFKSFGAKSINEFGSSMWSEYQTVDSNDYQVTEFLEQIINAYGDYSGTQLSWMTHQPETAWSKGKVGTLINFQEMTEGKV